MIDRETFSSAFLNADCMDVMREYPDNFFDLAIVDPPYGDANADSTRGGVDGERPTRHGSEDTSTSTRSVSNRRNVGE